MQKSQFRKTLMASVITSVSMAGLSVPAFAQEVEEVLVTGVRASLERSMDIKRTSQGVVDAISAEDIGKFPDTNLAESMQRIAGVSIDRVNGEGSTVTVRGFGAEYNMVTLNGRQMPSSMVSTVGGDQNSDWATGSSRSFDFSNLAAEGVSGLEVYKTGRADIESGGIGATVNIKTVRPLDKQGLTASIGVKALHDTSVEFSGDDVTPEASGLLSWSDDEGVFGVSLFGSYQERNSSIRSATGNAWNIIEASDFLDPTKGYINADTSITGLPQNYDGLVSIPNDSRWHLSEVERERTNAVLTFQYRPMENLTLTADAIFIENELVEVRGDQSNWFNRPFKTVRFDGKSPINTSVYLDETINGVKDTGFEQQYRAIDNSAEQYGFNAEWAVNDEFKLVFDVATGSSESGPGAGGYNSVLVGIGAPVITSHSLDFSGDFPIQTVVIDDSVRGNGNGQLDVGDLGSQMGRTVISSQEHELDTFNLEGVWNFSDNATLVAGIDYRTSEMTQTRTQTEQTLGNWGIENVGDIPADLIDTYCLACLYDDFNPKASGNSLVAFRGNALALYNHLSPSYLARDSQKHKVNVVANDNNRVKEEILSLYLQAGFEGQFAGLTTRTNVGVRYESTDVTSTSLVSVPDGIHWVSDNDFRVVMGNTTEPYSIKGDYNNLLPNLDFSIDLRDDLVARASFSQTSARTGYGNLYASTTVGQPGRPIALGGNATGTQGNPSLKPLVSNNFDLSVEWYYGDSSYLSGGVYEKRVRNFVGSGVDNGPLFDLRDPSSGAAGTDSGRAAAILRDLGVDVSDVNLFTLTALIQNRPSDAAARAEFEGELVNGSLPQAYVDDILTQYDVVAQPGDPLYEMSITKPVNNREARIYGFEFGAQHFFGDSGFGIQANYTTVKGDVGVDVGSDPGVDQFALIGLSDTANMVLIYETENLSARLAYNWRDEFLSGINRGDYRNPVFTEDYSQIDLNIAYTFNDNWSVSFEAINLTGEHLRTHGRDKTNLWLAQENDPRYLLGARYSF